jgi:site-specific DNA-methyltransferase (adenine-specific)
MEVMATFADGHFDLAIVDPPYGLGAKVVNSGGRFARYKNERGNWDMSIPAPEYFTELARVSKRRIVWGGNYFSLPATGGWLFWDKDRRKDVSFADGELAWTDFLTTLKKITVRYDGFIGADAERIHPTQKPVALYKWLLANYAKPGMRILDTHLGSGSHAIAAHYAGVHLTACEIDADYFHAAKARIERETSQMDFLIPHNVKEHAPPLATPHAETGGEG